MNTLKTNVLTPENKMRNKGTDLKHENHYFHPKVLDRFHSSGNQTQGGISRKDFEKVSLMNLIVN